MERNGEQKIYGFTGEIGKDGLLTPDLQVLLNQKQHEAAQAVLDHLGRRGVGDYFPIAAMATGIGKTRVEHEVIEQWRNKNPGARILFIAGTKLTLVQQAQDNLVQYQEEPNADVEYTESEELVGDTTETEDIEDALEIEQEDLPFYRVGRFKDKDADVRVATIQTIQSAYKRGQLDPTEFDLVIVDEVHNIGTTQRASAIYQFSNVIGFTATPNRHSGQMKRPEQYGFEVAYNFPLPEAQRERLLPPLLGMQVDTTGLVEEVPTTLGGRIDYKRLEKILKKSPDLYPFIADKVSEIIRDGDKEYKTVMAVNFVWEAQKLAQLFRTRGIKVGVAVNQQASKQIHTEEIPALGSIERYKLPQNNPRSIQVLISPYVASEGFDAPFTEVLVWASPTDSDLRYTQYVGRLARRSEGKLFGLNLDFLYQTSQYGWSYNMGMWMKGSVRQLPSGLLYLGPEQDIAGLAKLDAVKNMRRKGDVVDLSDLEIGSLEELKDSDLLLNSTGLNSLFKGGTLKLQPIAKKVRATLEVEHPEYFTRRKNVTTIVAVVTEDGRDMFIQTMKDRGLILKDDSSIFIQEGELPITIPGLVANFVGNGVDILPIARQIKSELEQEYPEYFSRRMSTLRSTQMVDVVTIQGRKVFIQYMVAKKVQLRDATLENTKDTDLSLTITALQSMFIGKAEKIALVAKKVRATLEVEHPEYFTKRFSGDHIVSVIFSEKGKRSFISAMVNSGVRLQEGSIENLRDTELSLSGLGLIEVFFGSRTSKLVPLAKQVKTILELKHPEYFAKRKSGTHHVDVVIAEGKQAFIDAMVAAGIRLKSK